MWSMLILAAGALAAHRDARVNHIPQNDVNELRHAGGRVHHYSVTTSSSKAYNSTSANLSFSTESVIPQQLTVTTSLNHEPTVSVYEVHAKTTSPEIPESTIAPSSVSSVESLVPASAISSIVSSAVSDAVSSAAGAISSALSDAVSSAIPSASGGNNGALGAASSATSSAAPSASINSILAEANKARMARFGA